MDNLLFSLRRAFHASNGLARRLLTGFALTPSRFDMLYAIRQCGDGKMLQSRLRRVLGVTAATVTRMLDALEQLGFARRERPPFNPRRRRGDPQRGDRRQKLVRLTRAGRVAVMRVIHAALHDGIAGWTVRWFASDRPTDDAGAAHDVRALGAELVRVRRGLFDRATLEFPSRIPRPPGHAANLFWRRLLAFVRGERAEV
jgi:DNA-binding MarR family transcriptional regulator